MRTQSVLCSLVVAGILASGCGHSPPAPSPDRTGVVVQREPWNEQGLSRGENRAMAQLAGLYDQIYGRRPVAGRNAERSGTLLVTCKFVSDGDECAAGTIAIQPDGFGSADFQERVYHTLKRMRAGADACEAGVVGYTLTFSTNVYYALDSTSAGRHTVVPAMR
jgi:hypothetical protein